MVCGHIRSGCLPKMRPGRRERIFRNPMNQYQSDEFSERGTTSPYRGFTKKERLVPSLLLSTAIPFTLFFFGPFEAYCKNIEELGFVFSDFGALAFGFALLFSALLFLCLFFLPGRAFDVAAALLLGFGLMFFLQGNYLNLGLNALEGDGVGVATYGTGATVFNLILWILVPGGILASVFLVRRKRELLRLISIVLLVAVIGVQILNFLIFSLTTQVFVPLNERKSGEEKASETEDPTPKMLTTAGMTELSAEGNVVVFLVDRFDLNYYQSIIEEDPDFFASLDGFTLYDNHISKYSRTYPSVAYMLTGVENDYSVSRPAYFQEAYSSSGFLSDLKENGYHVNLYTEKYYAYDDASVFGGVVDNVSGTDGYTVLSRFGLFGDMLKLTLVRYLPIFAKSWVGVINSNDFNRHILYEIDQPLYETDMKGVYEELTKEAFTLTEDGRRFTFLHIAGCHLPNSYDENWDPISEDQEWNSDIALRLSFQIINRYLDEMKRLGVYEDATILITGDHAAAISDTKDLSGARVTTLMVKKKGDSGTPLAVSSAPVEQSYLRATIFASEGIEPGHDYGKSVFDVSESEKGKRYYHFQKTVSGGDDELVVYEVVGDAKDFRNWTLVDRIIVGNLYK